MSGFLLVTCTLSAFLYFHARNRGLRPTVSRLFTTILKTLRVDSVIVMPLGVEIYAFDRSQFLIHVTTLQSDSILRWFTNEDLLILTLAIFAATTVLLRIAKMRSDRIGKIQATPGLHSTAHPISRVKLKRPNQPGAWRFLLFSWRF